jgi:hypothetical protein
MANRSEATQAAILRALVQELEHAPSQEERHWLRLQLQEELERLCRVVVDATLEVCGP